MTATQLRSSVQPHKFNSSPMDSPGELDATADTTETGNREPGGVYRHELPVCTPVGRRATPSTPSGWVSGPVLDPPARPSRRFAAGTILNLGGLNPGVA